MWASNANGEKIIELKRMMAYITMVVELQLSQTTEK